MTCSVRFTHFFLCFSSSSSLEETFLKPAFDRISEDVGGGGSRLEASTRKPAVDIEEESPRDMYVHMCSVSLCEVKYRFCDMDTDDEIHG